MKVPCGKNAETGERVFVAEVPPGECLLPIVICPSCETPLQAKKGHELVHHFAHMPTKGPDRKGREGEAVYKTSSCTSSNESHHHQLAKRILIEQKRIVLPKLDFIVVLYEMTENYFPPDSTMARKGLQHFRNNFPHSKGLTAFNWRPTFEKIELEKTIKPDEDTKKDYFRADAVGTVKGNTGIDHDLIIELAVTNRVNWSKHRKIKREQISAIEVLLDRKKTENFTQESEWVNYIVEDAPRRWIYNKKFEELKNDFRKYMTPKSNKMIPFPHEKARCTRETDRVREALEYVVTKGVTGGAPTFGDFNLYTIPDEPEKEETAGSLF